MEINVSSGLSDGVDDVIYRVNYTGDTGNGFINGVLLADNLYNDIPWEIGMKRSLEMNDTNSMVFYFRPMFKDDGFI